MPMLTIGPSIIRCSYHHREDIYFSLFIVELKLVRKQHMHIFRPSAQIF